MNKKLRNVGKKHRKNIQRAKAKMKAMQKAAKDQPVKEKV